MTSRVSGHDPDIGLSLLIQEKQRAEAAAKKLEAKKMAEEEAAQLASSAKKASSKAASASKVHSFLSLPFLAPCTARLVFTKQQSETELAAAPQCQSHATWQGSCLGKAEQCCIPANFFRRHNKLNNWPEVQGTRSILGFFVEDA